ncbi:penicillin-binding transpeptidase domain-containing protein [Okibacterium endophyticum]
MNKELKRVGFVVLAMFLALFGSTTIIQVVQADALIGDARNTRALYQSYDTERGAILADGQVIAQSVPTGDEFVFQREYPLGELYAAVTGYYNPTQGSMGIEQSMNEYLSGSSNSQFFDTINRIIAGQPPKGAAVELTIDPVVQQAAWDALGDLQGAVVAIEPSTGRILAMVSKPTYDPNVLATHNIPQMVETYKALNADPLHPLINRAIGGDLNPPGSTFKVVVAAAALASGDYTPDSQFANPAQLRLPGTNSIVTNFTRGTCGSGETVTLAEAIRLSCNIPMAELAMELGDDAIREMADKFGFNQSMDIPTTTEASIYPPGLDEPQTGLTGFGQWEVRASPLQMALVSAGIANGGTLMQPTLVDEVIGSNLQPLLQHEPSVLSEVLDEDVALDLTAMMVAGVESGQASNARIEGVDVAGKTGTAENGESNPYTLWFTGFAPAENPEVAVAVVVENDANLGHHSYGDAIASPIAKTVIEAVLNK